MKKWIRSAATGSVAVMYWWIMLAGMILYDMACANSCW